MTEQALPILIVGLGNPGPRYQMTRHNIGFLVVEHLAKQLGVSLQKNKEFHGDLVEVVVDARKVFLLLPTTYMNNSGLAVQKLSGYYKIAPDRILVVSDDVSLPFGKLRIRAKGSSGGHNGLKSIEHSLTTQDYIRLKVGVGLDLSQDLADFVLASFSSDEKLQLEKVLENASQILMTFVRAGYDAAVKKIDELTRQQTSEISEKKIIKED